MLTRRGGVLGAPHGGDHADFGVGQQFVEPHVLLFDPLDGQVGEFLVRLLADDLAEVRQRPGKHLRIERLHVPENTMTANQITAALLIEIPRRYDARVWRQQSIVARYADRTVTAVPAGASDISGILGPTGRRIEIEVKAKKDRMRGQQPRWRDMIRAHGGIHIVARSVEQALEELEREVNGGA